MFSSHGQISLLTINEFEQIDCYFPCNHQKIVCFGMISEGIEVNYNALKFVLYSEILFGGWVNWRLWLNFNFSTNFERAELLFILWLFFGRLLLDVFYSVNEDVLPALWQLILRWGKGVFTASSAKYGWHLVEHFFFSLPICRTVEHEEIFII